MTSPAQYKILPQNGTKPKISKPIAEPLSVKELAASLRVSLRYVYQMRARGFFMRGDTRHRQSATLEEAHAWIKENKFRLVKSFGVIGTSVPVRILS